MPPITPDCPLHNFPAGIIGVMANLRLVETDGDGPVVLPSHPDTRFLLRENEDGSILLPAGVATEAQHEFDATRELRELLAAATSTPTVRRTRHRRR
jgi:hypothetical protein